MLTASLRSHQSLLLRATIKKVTILLSPMTLFINDVSTHKPDLTMSRLRRNAIALDRTVRLLGQGTFGKVVEGVDVTNGQRVAIKIIRAIQKYRDASKIEVRVLQKLKERDPMNRQ